MTVERCPRELDVRQAVADGCVTADLSAHAAGCEQCLTVWLRTAVPGTVGAGPPKTVDPSLVWARARRLRRLRAEAQISRIITAAQVTAGLLILGVLVFFGSRPATWPSLSLASDNAMLLAAGMGLMMLAAFGLSRLISQDQT